MSETPRSKGAAWQICGNSLRKAPELEFKAMQYNSMPAMNEVAVNKGAMNKGGCERKSYESKAVRLRKRLGFNSAGALPKVFGYLRHAVVGAFSRRRSLPK